MNKVGVLIAFLVFSGFVYAQTDKVYLGDGQPLIALGDESEFTIKGEVSDGVQLIEIKIFESGNLTEPLHTTTWQRNDGGEGPVNYILSESDEYTFVIDHYSNGASSESIRLKQILENALDLYIDGSLKFEKTKVTARRPVPEMMRDMNAIVQSGAAHYTEDKVFNGFSPAVQRQLDRVAALEWSNASFAIDGGSEQDKYLAIYFFVNKQVEDLKAMVHSEIDGVAYASVLSPSGNGSYSASSTREVFDSENFMIPIDMEADPFEKEIALEAEQPESIVIQPKRKVRKKDAWLVQELSTINKKIDRLAKKDKSTKYEERLAELEAQLIEIRAMLAERQDPIVPNTNNPIADLSELTGKNVTVRFDRYSNKISSEYELLLNETFLQLARNADHKVLITGYADKSGDPENNLRLSEMRAKAVKYFFQERGIEGERLLVNYFGDSRSSRKAPEERRVEIEWLTPDHP